MFSEPSQAFFELGPRAPGFQGFGTNVGVGIICSPHNYRV